MSAAVITYDGPVGRWEPGTPGRLVAAAAELFAEQGYERTTVAAIAERAGLTERTFFRYFPDKREVLFSGFEQLETELLAAVADAPAELPGLEVAVRAMRGIAVAHFADDLEAVRWREDFIEANEELRERELLKLAGIGVLLTSALRARGMGRAEAGLAADGALAVFRAAMATWTAPDGGQDLGTVIDATLDRFRGLVSGR